jgi:hypothetical protein
VGAESCGSLVHKNKIKMAELPKDICPYGGVGFFISDLRPYSKGVDIKSRVTNM